MLFLSGLQGYQVKKINNLNSNPSIIEMGGVWQWKWTSGTDLVRLWQLEDSSRACH